MSFKKVCRELNLLKNPEKAKFLARFFKTGKGQYAEGDIFLGIVVPEQRKVARKYKHMELEDVQNLLKSKIHEHRLVALLILVEKFREANEKDQEKIFSFYLRNIRFINNWDLVDGSAPQIIGGYLLKRPVERKILYRLAKSENLWDRRIAILATLVFIRNKEFSDTLKIAQELLKDKHDLIHKAVGWMLREIGKLDQKAEEEFLRKFHRTMPRTALRYAIERFDQGKRKVYMGLKNGP
jgi:3-methyladenine DNA glycosylase AlkD